MDESYQELEIADLVALALENDDLFAGIEKILRQRFANKWVLFDCLRNLRSPQVSELESDGIVSFGDYQTASLFVEHFGHVILNLTLNYNEGLTNDQNTNLFQLINEHCSNALIELRLWNVHGNQNPFAVFCKPFTKLNHVTLRGEFQTLNNRNLKFTEIFPEMTHLTVENLLQISDSTWLNQHFPNVRHFNGPIAKHENLFDEDSFKQLIANNRQIRHLSLKSVNAELLQFLAFKLLDLESLQLRFYTDAPEGVAVQNVHFGKLKKLTIHESFRSFPAHVTFGADFEEFNTDAFGSTNWLNFVNNWKSLKTVSVDRLLIDDEVLQLENTNLSVINLHLIYPPRNDAAEKLIKLIENSHNLRYFHLEIDRAVIGGVMTKLQERFSSEWSVEMPEVDEFYGSIFLQRTK